MNTPNRVLPTIGGLPLGKRKIPSWIMNEINDDNNNEDSESGYGSDSGYESTATTPEEHAQNHLLATQLQADAIDSDDEQESFAHLYSTLSDHSEATVRANMEPSPDIRLLLKQFQTSEDY